MTETEVDMEHPAQTLLYEALLNATSAMYIDIDTLDDSCIEDIVNGSYYDSSVDFSTIVEAISDTAFKISDKALTLFKDDPTPITEDERNTIAREVHEKLIRIPIKYEIFFPLPSHYPSNDKQLLGSVSIKKITPAMNKAYQPDRPIDILSALAGAPSSSVAPQEDEYYMVIEDTGLVRRGGNIVLENRHDPLRIFRLYMALNSVTSTSLRFSVFLKHDYMGRAFDDKNFVANVDSTINSNASLATLSFLTTTKEQMDKTDEIFSKLLTEQAEPMESKRIELCNSLHWYFEYANTKEPSLRLVYLTSAFNSLFGLKGKKYDATVRDIAPVVAEANAVDFNDKASTQGNIEKLFRLRNNVIHGRQEIQSFRRIDVREINENNTVIKLCTTQYKKYMNKLLEQYMSSLTTSN